MCFAELYSPLCMCSSPHISGVRWPFPYIPSSRKTSLLPFYEEKQCSEAIICCSISLVLGLHWHLVAPENKLHCNNKKSFSSTANLFYVTSSLCFSKALSIPKTTELISTDLQWIWSKYLICVHRNIIMKFLCITNICLIKKFKSIILMPVDGKH
jgi:hypothetical protein